MNKYLPSLLLGWILVIALDAHLASGGPVFTLEDHGTTTYDPNTGLEWLDLSLTAGRSYNTVLGGWNGYTTVQGFRFATRSEVTQLFTDAGAVYLGRPSGDPNQANLQAASLTLSLLGTTDIRSSLRQAWMFYDPSTEPSLPSSFHVPSAIFGVGVLRAGYPEEGDFLVPGSFPLRDNNDLIMASALVRVVPEPSPAMLTGIGLGFMLFVLRRADGSNTRDRCRAFPDHEPRRS